MFKLRLSYRPYNHLAFTFSGVTFINICVIYQMLRFMNLKNCLAFIYLKKKITNYVWYTFFLQSIRPTFEDFPFYFYVRHSILGHKSDVCIPKNMRNSVPPILPVFRHSVPLFRRSVHMTPTYSLNTPFSIRVPTRVHSYINLL